MDGNASSSILRRPSVIKWADKRFAPDLNSKNDDCVDCTTQERFHQEHEKSKDLDASPKCKQATKHNTTEKTYNCLVCGKKFKWRSHWKSHERIHTGERPFQCAMCGKSFTRSDGLQCHKKVHFKISKECLGENSSPNVLENNIKQDKVFVCQFCGRTFGSLAGYYRHTNNKHKDKDDQKCYVCNIIFNRPSALKIHNRVHTGLKPYHCDICSKAFSVRGNLKRHLLIHTGERPYNCPYCSSCFNNSSHLTRHVKSKHEKQLLFKV